MNVGYLLAFVMRVERLENYPVLRKNDELLQLGVRVDELRHLNQPLHVAALRCGSDVVIQRFHEGHRPSASRFFKLRIQRLQAHMGGNGVGGAEKNAQDQCDPEDHLYLQFSSQHLRFR